MVSQYGFFFFLPHHVLEVFKVVYILINILKPEKLIRIDTQV